MTRAARLSPLLILAAAAQGFPQQDVGTLATVRHIEGGLDLRHIFETAIGGAAVNQPLAAGDELGTEPGGRAELLLPDGSLVWLDSNTRIDLVAFSPAAFLRLWHGEVVVQWPGPAAGDGEAKAFRIDTETGTSFLLEAGRYRVGVTRDGITRLAVDSGLAEAGGGRGSVLVHAGERTSASPGELPETPYLHNTASTDPLNRYVRERVERIETRLRYDDGGTELPAPVEPYRGELVTFGRWRQVESYGSVWCPTVGTGWRPYLNGRWAAYPEGLTWISDEPWGYVTHHFGVWDFAPEVGWFWIPGGLYAPAWVDFYSYGDYVGWCPSGRGHDVHHGHEPRVVRDRLFDPDRGVTVKRDRLFDRRLGEHEVPVQRVRSEAPPARFSHFDEGEFLPKAPPAPRAPGRELGLAPWRRVPAEAAPVRPRAPLAEHDGTDQIERHTDPDPDRAVSPWRRAPAAAPPVRPQAPLAERDGTGRIERRSDPDRDHTESPWRRAPAATPPIRTQAPLAERDGTAPIERRPDPDRDLAESPWHVARPRPERVATEPTPQPRSIREFLQHRLSSGQGGGDRRREDPQEPRPIFPPRPSATSPAQAPSPKPQAHRSEPPAEDKEAPRKAWGDRRARERDQ